MTNASSKNIFTLVFLALVWGSSYVLMKRGLVAFSAVQVSALRIIISAVVLTPFLRKVSKKDLPFLVITAFLGSGIPTFIYPYVIENNLGSSIAGIINSLTPVFTLFFGVLLFKTKTNWVSAIGIAIAFFGASFLIVSGKNLQELNINTFALIAILAPLFYGFSTNILKSKLNHIPALSLTAFTFALLLPFAIWVLFQTDFLFLLKNHENAYSSLGYIAILGVLGTAIALVVFNYLIRETTAIYASSVTFLMPIVVLAWGFYEGENIGIPHLMALLFILIGVYFLNYFKK